MLMIYMEVPPLQAVEFNPHGFRHTMVMIGQQLKTFGVIREDDLDRLGHWSKGSSMPRHYDSVAGVSELGVRVALLNQIRSGWRPVGEGCLPPPPLRVGTGAVKVGQSKQYRIHLWTSWDKTLCGWWKCGHSARPEKNAMFNDCPADMEWCRHCRKHWELQ